MIRQSARRGVLAGYLFALGAAAAYGTAGFLGKRIVEDFAPPLVTSAFALLFGALFMSLIVGRQIPQALRAPRRGYLFMILAGLSASLAVTSFFFAVSVGSLVVIAPLASVQPLVALTLSHLFLQRLERVTVRIVSGTVLVVAGVILVVSVNVGGQ